MDPQNPRAITGVFGWQFKGMRWWFRRSVGLAATLGLSLVILAPGAVAQGGRRGQRRPRGSDGGLVVPAGETAKTAVVFNGDVLIDGTVSETLVVFNGRTEITGTIGEDVVVFNGSVVLRSGARVGGDVVSRQTPQIEDGATVDGSIDDLQKRWDYWDITFVGRLGWWLAYTVSTLVLGLVLLMLARGLDPASIQALETAWGRRSGSGSCGSSCCRSWPSYCSSRSSESPWGCSYSLGSGSCTRSATWSAVLPSAGSSSRSQLLGTSRSSPDGGIAGARPSPVPRRDRLARGDGARAWDALGRRTGTERGSDGQGPRVAERRARSGLVLRRCQVELGAQYRPMRPFRGRSHTDAC